MKFIDGNGVLGWDTPPYYFIIQFDGQTTFHRFYREYSEHLYSSSEHMEMMVMPKWIGYIWP